MPMPRNLRHDHDQLRAIIARFAVLMEEGQQAFAATLLRDRVAFAQLFRAHMAEEEAVALATLGDDPLRLQAAADFRLLFQDYSAHISTWTRHRIAADWQGYRTAVLTLQTRLLARMDWEEQAIHPRLMQGQIAA